MVLDEHQPFLVQAVYSFKGKNNDELCFKKGDIITVTQLEEGGWWEGTLGEKTGWFPSNYVKEYKVQSDNLSPVKTCDVVAQQRAYRSVVLKDFIDSEKLHVNELQQLIQNIIVPVEKSHLLTKEETAALVNNIREVVNLHENILSGVESAITKPPSEQRVGKLMLGMAPRFKQTHHSYCSVHPHAAFIINKHKDKLSSLFQTEGINLLTLTTGLSKPFRRIEKYTNHLQELERHLEESHPDRGDTQRAVSVYKDIANACSVVRRQKEMEVEIMNGGVRGWEGQDISKMGEIIHMGSVAVGPEHRDRYLVLFPTTLLMLSASHRMSAFIYEGKLPLTGITVNKLEDTESYKNAFEVTGPLIEKILAICQTKEDQQRWVDVIKEQCNKFGAKASPLALHKKRENVMIDHSTNGPWSMTRLRPSAPTRLRPSAPTRLLKPAVPPKNDFERDAQILRVIESYCTSANSRFTLNSAAEKIRRAESPQPLVQRKPRPRRASTWCCDETDSEKVDNCMNASKITDTNSKDLSGTVYELHERILQLQNELDTLKTDVKVEKTAREQLEAFVQNNQCPTTPKEEANGS